MQVKCGGTNVTEVAAPERTNRGGNKTIHNFWIG